MVWCRTGIKNKQKSEQPPEEFMTAKQTEISLRVRGCEGGCGTGIKKQQNPVRRPEGFMAAKQTEIPLLKRRREGGCGTGIGGQDESDCGCG